MRSGSDAHPCTTELGHCLLGRVEFLGLLPGFSLAVIEPVRRVAGEELLASFVADVGGESDVTATLFQRDEDFGFRSVIGST